MLENSAIELHDSVFAHIAQRGERIEISLAPAYVHKSNGVPGVDAGTGWIQNVTIVLEGGHVEGELPNLPCELSDGMLIIRDQAFENEIPLPLDQDGPVLLRLDEMWSNRSISFRGSRIVVTVLGEPKYVEQFPGAS